MKDEYKRRRKAERPLIKALPDVDPNHVYTPVHQECLDVDCGFIESVSAQGNELIATSNSEWWLEVYALDNEDASAPFNPNSTSQMSELCDAELIPNRSRRSDWRVYPRDMHNETYKAASFIAPDVIGCVEPETPGVLSTWYVCSSQCLESVTLRGVQFNTPICKISNTEFVIGSKEGHLCIFTHEEGCNLQESTRVWKAHSQEILFISFHKDTVISTSLDCTARLWDVKTKKRLMVLYHEQRVFTATISDKYIVTCSQYGRSHLDKGELRIYSNYEGYSLVKILRDRESIGEPLFIDAERVLCRILGPIDDNGRRFIRNSLVVVDIERESVLAQLKVACRLIYEYTILADGRLVAVGAFGCRGVIATFPDHLRKLIAPKSPEKALKVQRRRMCSLM